MGDSTKLTFKDIHREYLDWMLPALAELEKDLEERIRDFEAKYACKVLVNQPTPEQVRFEKKNLVLGQVHSAHQTYNLTVRHLGLNQDDYPDLQYS